MEIEPCCPAFESQFPIQPQDLSAIKPSTGPSMGTPVRHMIGSDNIGEPMKKWPKSRFAHACIAFLGATIIAAFAFRPILGMRMNTYIHESPRDGQDSLAAFFDACVATFCIETGSGVLLFMLQRKISRRSSA